MGYRLGLRSYQQAYAKKRGRKLAKLMEGDMPKRGSLEYDVQKSVLLPIIARNLRAYQERTKLTNEALAEKLKVSPTTLTGLMRAGSNVSVGMLEKIAAKLDLTIWDLLEQKPTSDSLSNPPHHGMPPSGDEPQRKVS